MNLDNLQSRPPSHSFSSRADIRHLATLASFFKSNGIHPRSVAELVRLSLETLSETLIKNRLIDYHDNLIEAEDFMKSIGLSASPLKKNISQILINEGIEVDVSQLKTKHPKQKISQSNPLAAEAVERLSDLIKKENESEERISKQLEGLNPSNFDATDLDLEE